SQMMQLLCLPACWEFTFPPALPSKRVLPVRDVCVLRQRDFFLLSSSSPVTTSRQLSIGRSLPSCALESDFNTTHFVRRSFACWTSRAMSFLNFMASRERFGKG